jgi:hypothetical protein
VAAPSSDQSLEQASLMPILDKSRPCYLLPSKIKGLLAESQEATSRILQTQHSTKRVLNTREPVALVLSVRYQRGMGSFCPNGSARVIIPRHALNRRVTVIVPRDSSGMGSRETFVLKPVGTRGLAADASVGCPRMNADLSRVS